MTNYNMLTSEDGGTTWIWKGMQEAVSQESALSKFFPKPRIIGHQYNGVASSHWQPVEEAVREVPYTRTVTGPVPAAQPSLLDALDTPPDASVESPLPEGDDVPGSGSIGDADSSQSEQEVNA